MKNKKLDAAQVWKQFEDLLAPKLNFSRTDRAIYSHLFRHSRLEGKLQFRFSIAWLARGVSLSMKATRGSVRRLVARGVLGLVERNCRSQHVVRVRLPLEVKGLRATRKTSLPPPHPAFAKIEEADFMEKQVLRLSLHAREGGHCFYCLRRCPGDRKCLDHVVPQAQRRQFLPQFGVLLRGLQFTKRRADGGGVSALAVPRAAIERRRTGRAPARSG
jgi:hypothetical protein